MSQYDYVVELVQRSAPHGAVVLDYGCGAGQIVQGLLGAGVDAHGVDVFYGGGTLRDAATATGLFGTRIRELDGARIPWPDASVDFVVSNMVFEHIDGFEAPLAEIARVLRPGGTFVNLFPSSAVWREGHVGLPLVHRFGKGDFGLRLRFATALRKLGLGHNKGDKPIDVWAHEALEWIDRWTHYKPLAEIEQTFARWFEVTRDDGDFLLGRLRAHRRLARLAPLAALRPLAPLRAWAAGRLATHVFVLSKRASV